MSERVMNSLANRIFELDNMSTMSTTTHDFVDKMRNVSTKNVTDSHMRLFVKWLYSNGETRTPEQIESKQLDMYLAHFTLTVRKEGDGDDAKLTISFAGYGLKKLVAKFAQLKTQP